MNYFCFFKKKKKLLDRERRIQLMIDKPEKLISLHQNFVYFFNLFGRIRPPYNWALGTVSSGDSWENVGNVWGGGWSITSELDRSSLEEEEELAAAEEEEEEEFPAHTRKPIHSLCRKTRGG